MNISMNLFIIIPIITLATLLVSIVGDMWVGYKENSVFNKLFNISIHAFIIESLSVAVYGVAKAILLVSSM